MRLLVLALLLTGCSSTGGGAAKKHNYNKNMDPIRDVLKDNVDRFRDCATEDMSKGNSSAQSVTLNFKIESSGSTTAADVSSKGKVSSFLKSCMANIVKEMQFPPTHDGGHVTVKQPLNIKPKS
jgi:hypothetical protein